jgi:adenosylcobyric acid synthase
MLGKKIYDHANVESNIEQIDGLGLLDINTSFKQDKVTTQVTGKVVAKHGLFSGLRGTAVSGYEIHMGRSESAYTNPVFSVMVSGADSKEGTIDKTGSIFGTYMHGIFHNANFTCGFLNNLCALRQIANAGYLPMDRQKSYDELAATFRKHLDMEKIYSIISGGIHG